MILYDCELCIDFFTRTRGRRIDIDKDSWLVLWHGSASRRTGDAALDLVDYARYNENFVLVVTSSCCIRWDSMGYQGPSPWLVSVEGQFGEPKNGRFYVVDGCSAVTPSLLGFSQVLQDCYGLNSTATVVCTTTGFPSTRYGSNRHQRSAFTAACPRISGPLRAFTFTTEPSRPTTTSSTITPRRFAGRAAAG